MADFAPHKSEMSKEQAMKALEDRETYIGRDHVTPGATFTGGFDQRRMQPHRRVLKPCPYCGAEFGTNEMTRHKRAEHKAEMEAKRVELLAMGRVKRQAFPQAYNPSGLPISLRT